MLEDDPPNHRYSTQESPNYYSYTSFSRSTGSINVSKTSYVSASETTTNNYGIQGTSSDINNVSDKSAKVIANSMDATGEPSVQVTSTTRTPEKQASVMYDNIQKTSVDNQKALYKDNGDKVIDTYSSASAEKGATPTSVKSAMTGKINELGPQTVSAHCGDLTKINVIDIALSSVSNVSNFQNNLKSNQGVSKLIPYPTDPGIHIEINQNSLMKKIFLYTCLLTIVCIAISCKNANPNIKIGQYEKVDDTTTKKGITNKISASIEVLQGIWAENDKDNALFFIKADSLYYVEDQAKPVKIILNSDTLVIMGDVPAHCKILKLTKDSLWFIDEFNDTPMKLYKR